MRDAFKDSDLINNHYNLIRKIECPSYFSVGLTQELLFIHPKE